MQRLSASVSTLRHAYRVRPAVVAVSVLLVTAAVIHNVLMLHAGAPHLPGEPVWCTAVAEVSSGLAVLMLVPLVDRLVERFPLRRQGWHRALAVHLVAVMPFSIAHVLGMVALREAAFGLAGAGYDFGSVANWLGEELPKDAVTYALIVAVITGLNRLLADPARAGASEEAQKAAGGGTFAVSGHGRTVLVRQDAIRRVEASGNYVTLHTGDGAHLYRSTLRDMSRHLPAGRFLQVHRSHLIRPEDVATVNRLRSGDWSLHLCDGSVVPMSRRFARSGALERIRPR